MFGSSPHIAEPARLALALPALFAAENGVLIVALCVERYTNLSFTIVPT